MKAIAKDAIKYLRIFAVLLAFLAVGFGAMILFIQYANDWVMLLIGVALGPLIISFVYGILSYILAKNAVIPNLLLLIFLLIFFFLVAGFYENEIAGLIMNIVLVILCDAVAFLSYGVSIAVSKIMHGVSRLSDNFKQRKCSFVAKYSDFFAIFSFSLFFFILRTIVLLFIEYPTQRYVFLILLVVHICAISPCLCIYYGVLVAKSKEKILIPNLIFAAADFLLYVVSYIISVRYFDEYIWSQLIIILALELALCLTSSFVARIAFQKRKFFVQSNKLLILFAYIASSLLTVAFVLTTVMNVPYANNPFSYLCFTISYVNIAFYTLNYNILRKSGTLGKKDFVKGFLPTICSAAIQTIMLIWFANIKIIVFEPLMFTIGCLLALILIAIMFFIYKRESAVASSETKT